MRNLNLVIVVLLLMLLSPVIGDSQTSTTAKQFPDLCELRANPESYVSEIVEVRAKYVASLEMGWLESINECSAAKRSTAVRYFFDEVFQSAERAKTYKLFMRKLKPRKGTGLLGSVTGVFRLKVERYEKLNEMDRRFDFQFRILGVRDMG
jgi:hypothetical protein